MRVMFFIAAILPALIYGWVAIPLTVKVKIRTEAGAWWWWEAEKLILTPMSSAMLWCVGVLWFSADRMFLWNMAQLPPPPQELLAITEWFAVFVSLAAASAAMFVSMCLRGCVERFQSVRSQRI
jgi:hypothetical protein